MYTLNCGGQLISLEKPVVMGILNLTPDSFFAPSRAATASAVLDKARAMVAAGATIIDIGAQSTRPGSVWLSAEEEWERLKGIFPMLKSSLPDTVFSIDSFHHQVAHKAVTDGATMVNDVSGGWLDQQMLATVAALKVPYVCMHMKGNAQTMTSLASYDNILKNITDYFIERIASCQKAGIKDLVLDMGFGFAKQGAQNFYLLKNFGLFQQLGCALLLGVSRKSMITKTLQIEAADALNGTTVLHTIGLLQGAKILRVHDVQAAMEAIRLVETMQQSTA
jgi:dihydropteroate synthase